MNTKREFNIHTYIWMKYDHVKALGSQKVHAWK